MELYPEIYGLISESGPRGNFPPSISQAAGKFSDVNPDAFCSVPISLKELEIYMLGNPARKIGIVSFSTAFSSGLKHGQIGDVLRNFLSKYNYSDVRFGVYGKDENGTWNSTSTISVPEPFRRLVKNSFQRLDVNGADAFLPDVFTIFDIVGRRLSCVDRYGGKEAYAAMIAINTYDHIVNTWPPIELFLYVVSNLTLDGTAWEQFVNELPDIAEFAESADAVGDALRHALTKFETIPMIIDLRNIVRGRRARRDLRMGSNDLKVEPYDVAEARERIGIRNWFIRYGEPLWPLDRMAALLRATGDYRRAYVTENGVPRVLDHTEASNEMARSGASFWQQIPSTWYR